MKRPVKTLDVVFNGVAIVVFLVEVLGDDGKEYVDVGDDLFSFSFRFALLILFWIELI